MTYLLSTNDLARGISISPKPKTPANFPKPSTTLTLPLQVASPLNPAVVLQLQEVINISLLFNLLRRQRPFRSSTTANPQLKPLHL